MLERAPPCAQVDELGPGKGVQPAIRRRPPKGHEALGVVDWQPTEEHLVAEAEHADKAADAKGEDGDNRRCEAWAAQERATREAKIKQHCTHDAAHGQSRHCACQQTVLFGLRIAAQLRELDQQVRARPKLLLCSGECLFDRKTVSQTLVNEPAKVVLQLRDHLQGQAVIGQALSPRRGIAVHLVH